MRMNSRFSGVIFGLILVSLVGASALAVAPPTLTQSVTYNSETITLQMTKESVRGTYFEVLVQNSGGGYDAWTAGEVRTYVGTVDEYPGAYAAGILLSNDVLKARVYFDRGATWYTEGSSVTGTRGTGDPTFKLASKPSVAANHWGTDTYLFDVGYDSDYRYYNTMGSVAACVEMMEFSTVCLKVQYIQDALLMPAMGRVIVRPYQSQCPYDAYSGTDILVPFRDEWNNNQTGAVRDVAALATPNIGGGVAWLGVIGTTNAYSVNGIGSDGSFDVVWRHELGHNWSVYDFHANSPEGPTINCGNAYGRFNGPAVESIFNHRDNKLSILDSQGTYSTIDFGPYAALDVISNLTPGGTVYVDIMENDFDANAQTISLDSYDGTSALGGTVTLSSGTGGNGRDELVYTAPDNAFNEVDYFYYTVQDSAGNFGTGVVTVYLDLDNTIKGYYPMDETTGTTAGDVSQFGNDGTLVNGASFDTGSVTGQFATGLDLDGTDDHVEISNLNLNSNTVTITAWVNPAATPSGWNGIVFNRAQDAAGLNFGSAGELRYHWDGTNWGWNSGLTPTVGSWNFVALVVEPSQATIYLNNGGSTQSATNTNTHAVQSFAGTTYIGLDSNSGTRHFNGAVDDVRIYNYSMSASEIEDVKDGGTACGPLPIDGATGVLSSELSWVESSAATSYDVYVGTSSTAVANATTASSEYQGSVTGTTFDGSSILSENTQYFWRIDTVTGGGTLAGAVWDFTTGAALDMVGFYKLDETSGSTAADSSGHGNDGTVTGASWVTGIDGNALSFDGVDDVVNLGTGPSLSGQTDFTVSAWVKTTATAAGVIVQQRNGGFNGEYVFNMGSDGTLGFMIYGNSAYQFSFSSTATVNDGEWHHVVAVRDGTDGYIYVDAGTPATASGTVRDLASNIGVGIGADIRDNNRYFNGLMDDVRIYDKALSSSEITDLHDAFTGGGDTTPPAAPTGLGATAGDGSVSLDWADNSEQDLASYTVYRSTTSGSGYSSIAQGVSTSDYTDNTVTNDTTYYYVVTAVDTSDNESDTSSEVSATPADTTAPAAPTGLGATAGDGSVDLDWADNSEGDLDSYTVYRSTTSGSGFAAVAQGLSASDYTDNTVTNGTTYYYVVTAIDTSSNESGYSGEVSATPQASSSTMYVQAIDLTVVAAGGPNRYGRAVVTIYDDGGQPLSGATVYGTFTGDYNESGSAVTDSNGQATITTAAKAKSPSFTFTVTNVTASGYTYDSASNVETSDTY
ncbi:Alpha-amylase/pullulanase [Anaerohalosphaera lusitana]|uniref:Alpha-amylase/pullulanase n=1 Tax=Anaerohalosphaera lusitana TaxID=1936003 RepID=A0A1U9NHB4_9BACT|nr:LamG-like jellyroll fold domain-containing protein [Anaerohalosphaera lusitana]AQT67157.1 Alpha-amylase/pullulanase [Anaerohalosphaera lusitana]